MGEQEPDRYQDVTCVRESPAALCVTIDGVDMWLPKKAVHEDSDVQADGDSGDLLVKDWFAEKFADEVREKCARPQAGRQHPTTNDASRPMSTARVAEMLDEAKAMLAKAGYLIDQAKKMNEQLAGRVKPQAPKAAAPSKTDDDDLPF